MTKRQTKNNSSSKSSASKKTAAGKSTTKRSWFFKLFWRVCLIGLVVLGAYAFYLDAQIKHAFSGNKWEVPAQIFARPLEVSKGEEITPQEVVNDLAHGHGSTCLRRVNIL